MLLLLESAATNSAGDITPTGVQSIVMSKSFIRMAALTLFWFLFRK